MNVPSDQVLLSYCTNSFAGGSWTSVLRHLTIESSRIFAEVPGVETGLWIGKRAVSDLLESEQFEIFINLCRGKRFKISSINGFPYGDFQGSRVKSAVYFPNWSDPARLHYTHQLIQVAQGIYSALGSQITDFSISTLPLGDRWSFRDSKQIERASYFLSRMIETLHDIECKSGCRVHLALEPEPFCFLETAQDVVHYFQDFLMPIAIPALRGRWEMSSLMAQEVVLDKIRVCYDTCHAAVLFQEPEEVLNVYQAAGVKIGKVQLSSALAFECIKGRVESGASAVDLMRPFADDRYVHQVVGIDSENHRSEYFDLNEALSVWEQSPPTGRFRVHYHVPVYQNRFGPLQSTQEHLLKLLRIAQNQKITSHWELETYTWSVLPVELRPQSVVEGVIQELQWIRGLS